MIKSKIIRKQQILSDLAAQPRESGPEAVCAGNGGSPADSEKKSLGARSFVSEDYHVIGADLRDITYTERQLLGAGMDFSLPTLFLSECVMVYIHPEESSRIIEWAAKNFTGGAVFCSYEQIHPHDPFGQTMMKNLKSRGCSLLGLETYPDLPAHRKRFLDLGWAHWSGWDMNDIYKHFLNPSELARIEKLELFDEFEEWHMIQGHYCINMAANEPKTSANEKESSPSWVTRVGLLGRSKTLSKPSSSQA